ncbi:hypothetical protein ACFO0N_11235 [Halobium salinum]|uniref:Uncharacterized protein n=1 Tax=Halobium salinum TaxID=1364940 RepID=A0ABD5PCR6_9EURY|nr:hypothetical protein [Halobium salinum]
MVDPVFVCRECSWTSAEGVRADGGSSNGVSPAEAAEATEVTDAVLTHFERTGHHVELAPADRPPRAQ